MSTKNIEILNNKITTILKKVSEAEQRIAVYSTKLNENIKISTNLTEDLKKLNSDKKAVQIKNTELVNSSVLKDKTIQDLSNELQITSFKEKFIRDELADYKKDNKLNLKELNALKDELATKKIENNIALEKISNDSKKEIEITKSKSKEDIDDLKSSHRKY